MKNVLPVVVGLTVAWGGTALLLSPADQLLGAPDRLATKLLEQLVLWVLLGMIEAIVLLWDNQPSYVHGHSALSRASSRHSGGKGGDWRAPLIPDTALPVSSGDRARSAASGQSPPDARARGVPVVGTAVSTPWSRGRVD
jgi:hypothetical protein